MSLGRAAAARVLTRGPWALGLVPPLKHSENKDKNFSNCDQMDKRHAQDPWLQQGCEACPGTGIHAQFSMTPTQLQPIGCYQHLSKHCPGPTVEATDLL